MVIAAILGVLVMAVVAAGVWFWWRYLRLQAVRIADGVHGVLGAGGNTLVVRSGDEVLVVDPKFGLGARSLRSWLKRHVEGRVSVVINTHYHYDHTQGNELYPGARIYAHSRARGFMLGETNDFNDPAWWKQREAALPNAAMAGTANTLNFGRWEVRLFDPGVAHTHGDLWVHLPAVNVIATGDLLFNGFYPFFNGSPAGCSIAGMVDALRDLARRFPDATFLPGHGPIARAGDLVAYADYLEQLQDKVTRAIDDRLPEAEAVRRLDVSRRGYTWLPSLLGTHLLVATPANNIRWAYRILSAKRA